MQGKTILIVDDEADMRDAISTTLTEVGATVITAVDGNDGLSQALEHHPDLILMDINMPHLDGHAAVEKLREDLWGQTARVIYLTAYSDAENVVRAVERGSEEYIVKTNMSLEDLVAKCKHVLFDYTD